MAVNKAVKEETTFLVVTLTQSDFLLNYILCHNFYY
jgi:hypothetical protein